MMSTYPERFRDMKPYEYSIHTRLSANTYLASALKQYLEECKTDDHKASNIMQVSDFTWICSESAYACIKYSEQCLEQMNKVLG